MDLLLHKYFYILQLVFLFLVAEKVRQVNNEEVGSSSCSSKSRCSECISSSPECSWCKENNNLDKSKRCDLPSNLKQRCSPEHIVHPSGIVDKEDPRNRPLSETGETIENVVQLSPQYIKVKLRKGQKQRFELKFRQAENYPVDLYYLMDVSATMKIHKQKLSDLGVKLAQEMSTITQNFRLGFGSFVDKEVMPFVSTVPEKLKNPCGSRDDTCDEPHSFINRMSLNSDSQTFQNEVQATKLSANLDSPEGGFDAIMQAILCDKEIGWRNKSRKLLIFSTDSGFHYAGDGKLGGIVKPFDGKCHMEKHRYIRSKEMDYPSISHVNHVAREKRVHIIFAVTKSITSLYARLSGQLDGSATGQLDQDSDNVVKLIKDEYEKIREKVSLRDTSEKSINVKYFSNCLHGSEALKETKECGELQVGQMVTFHVELELVSCDEKRIKPIKISPLGVGEELTVEVETICGCECEQPAFQEQNSPRCSNGNGTLECGICKCHEKRYGSNCQCSSENARQDDNDAPCKKDNSSIVCSNRGACFCGQCECDTETLSNADHRYYGTYCECDNFSCERNGGEICSGKDHGTCDCGSCKCNPGWSGKACECKDGTDMCFAPGSKEMCSGNGECKCGVCKCKETKEGRYSGQHCEDCPKCAGKCETYRPCVQCLAFQTGQLSKDECANCTFKPKMVDVVKEEHEDERTCIFKDEDDCKFTFVYKINQANVMLPEVRVQKTKECPTSVNVAAIVGGVVGGIVAIGLIIILIWKMFTSIHDRREYAKFEQERKNAQFDSAENPIYKRATTNFPNPTYANK